jgi:IclR family acetate operon transcriptional repressor
MFFQNHHKQIFLRKIGTCGFFTDPECFFIRLRSKGLAMTSPRPRGRPRAFTDKTDQNRVQSIDRAMTLLQRLADSPGLTLSELAAAEGEAPATVYRVLVTLQVHGIVELEDPGQIWHVGSGAFRIGSAFLRRTKVVERSRQPMDRLMRDTGETSNLGVESGDQVLFLSQVETHAAIRAFFPPGTKSPMHVSGIGKALLAWYPAPRVSGLVARQGLPGFTPQSITDAAALAAGCGQVALVVATEPIRARCDGSARIDRFTVWRRGSHAVWVTSEGARLRDAATARGDRPWVPPAPAPGRPETLPLAPRDPAGH